MKILSNALLTAVMLGVVAPAPAHAYLDGATVSIVLQAVTGAVASALLFGKLYWTRIKGIFSRSQAGEQD